MRTNKELIMVSCFVYAKTRQSTKTVDGGVMNRRIAFASLLFATGALAGPYDGDTRPDAILIATIVVFVPFWILVLGVSTAVKKYYYQSAFLKTLWFGESLACVATAIFWILMVIVIYANFDS
jgi:hypothetical protein